VVVDILTAAAGMSQTQVTQPEERMQPVAYTSSRVPSWHTSNNSDGTRTNYRAAAPRHRASKAERKKLKKLKKSLHEANMQQVQQNNYSSSNSTSSTSSTISTLVQAAAHDQSISTTTDHRPGAYGTDHLATATVFQFNIMQCCCSIVAPTNEPFEYNNTTVTTAPAPPPSSLQLDQYSPIEEEERGVMQEDQQQLLVKNLRTQCFITPAFQKRGAEYDAHIWSMPINFMLQVRKERKKERKKERNFILQFSHKFHFAALIF
jgi:hypothetical protein